MTDLTLAQNSNYLVYSAMAVLTLAMLAYAAYLAWLVPARSAAADERAEGSLKELVSVGNARAEAAAGADPVAARPAGASASAAGASAAVGEEAAYGGVVEPPRARKAASIAGMLTWLGTALLVGGVVLRGASVHRWPLGNMYEFAIVGAMFALVLFSAWSTRRDLRWMGIFVVTPVLLTLGVAITVWYTEAAQLMPSLKSVFLAIHVTVATVSAALFFLAFALVALYLLKDRLGPGRSRVLDRMPEPKALERLAYGVHIIAFPLWTFTVIAGAIWARQAWGAYWNWDPKEVWSFVIWVAYAAYLHARATSGFSRRTAAWISVAGFVCLVLNFAVVNMFFVSQHSYSGL